MSEVYRRAAPTLLPLLEAAINRVLENRPPGERVYPARVRLESDGVLVEFGFSAPGPFSKSDFRIPLRLTILSTDPARTECAWELGKAPRLSKLLRMGLSLAPRDWLDDLLRRHLGAGVRLEGDKLIVDHAELIASLTGRSSQDS